MFATQGIGKTMQNSCLKECYCLKDRDCLTVSGSNQQRGRLYEGERGMMWVFLISTSVEAHAACSCISGQSRLSAYSWLALFLTTVLFCLWTLVCPECPQTASKVGRRSGCRTLQIPRQFPGSVISPGWLIGIILDSFKTQGHFCFS